ncbi:hypothetical protein J1N35_018401 [Gossypium stocksii]|uniref:Uncharacterized protein n=1 Tax=Gossypium stocksii TaxID=47602 RepID=A0A9D3VPT5_9ROSI|nr:hypothetical protein J1N35_018401 [Gossypium stocksii]
MVVQVGKLFQCLFMYSRDEIPISMSKHLKFWHVPRDHNKLTNCMTNVASSDLNKLSMFEDLPIHAQSVFENDAHRTLEVISLHQANYN